MRIATLHKLILRIFFIFITVILASKTLLEFEFHSLPRLTGAINAVRFLNPPLSLSFFEPSSLYRPRPVIFVGGVP